MSKEATALAKSFTVRGIVHHIRPLKGPGERDSGNTLIAFDPQAINYNTVSFSAQDVAKQLGIGPDKIWHDDVPNKSL